MVTYVVADDEPDSFINFVPIYKSNQTDHDETNQNFLFDFQVVYTRVPEPDSDGEEDLDYDNLESRTIRQTHLFDKDWLIGGDKDRILAVVYHILEIIQVPSYKEIVMKLTEDIFDLKKREAISTLPKLEKINVDIDVMVRSLPGGGGEDNVDVKLAVAPASDEAVEMNFETVVVEKEGYCVICMDKIRVGSDMEAGRMPCLHVFHRSCGVDWLRSSGVCPVCRAVFPSVRRSRRLRDRSRNL